MIPAENLPGGGSQGPSEKRNRYILVGISGIGMPLVRLSGQALSLQMI